MIYMFIIYIKLYLYTISIDIMYRNNSTDNKPYIVPPSDNSSVSSIENINDTNIVYVETKKNTEFNDLSYEDVQINLRLLVDLKEGEKLMVTDGRYIQVDRRYVQGFRRYITSDSRSKSLNFINHVIYWSKKYCNDAVENINKNRISKYNYNLNMMS